MKPGAMLINTGRGALVETPALIEALNKAKPSGAKGVYVKRIGLSSTMGPGFKVDTSSVG